MTVSMYARAKALFARRELDWRALPVTAYLVDANYLPALETDQLFPAAEVAGTVLASVALTNLTVDDAAWCAADPVVFVNATLTVPCGQAVIALADAAAPLALLLLEFPLLAAKATPDTYSLLFAQRGPGWFRL
jgi:hypothetical protein